MAAFSRGTPMRLAAAVVFSLLSPLMAQAVYVDATRGNDAWSGTATAPVRSLTRGLGLAGAGSTILVYAGVYGVATTGEVLPLAFGTLFPQQGVTLRGTGGVVLDCGGVGGAALKVGPQASGGRITGITFRNMGSSDWYARVIEAGSYKGPGSATGFEIDRCRFENVNRGVLIWENSPPVTGWRVHSNVFANLANDGVNDFFAGSSNEIFLNTFVGNLQIGITSDGATSKVFDNVLVGCRVGIGAGTTQVAGNFLLNDVWNCQIPWQGIGAPPGNLALDPRFVNQSAGDFHLLATSPLIDAGVLPTLLRGDYDGNSRAIDSNLDGSIAPDLGAFERTPLAATGSYANSTLNIGVTCSVPSLPFAVVGFALDDGIIQVPGWSPILLDPATLFTTVTGSLPLQLTFPNLVLPPGLPVVVQAFTIAPSTPGLVPGNQVWIQG